MATLKSKKALLYDARLTKSNPLTMKVSSSNYDSNTGGFSANILDSRIESVNDAGGTASREISIITNYVTFSKEEIAAADKKVKVDDFSNLSLGQQTEVILLTALLSRMKTEKLYGSSDVDWEIEI